MRCEGLVGVGGRIVVVDDVVVDIDIDIDIDIDVVGCILSRGKVVPDGVAHDEV